MMMMNKIVNLIKDADNILIVTHISPDGDAIGSSLGLLNGLKLINKNVDLIIDDCVPKDFMFLSNAELIKMTCSGDYDLAIAVDVSDERRMGSCLNLYKKAKTKISIDHHASNTMFADINLIDKNAAATCELVYQTLKLLDIDFDKNISTCLLCGIITDSGRFMFPNTTSITHEIAGDLLNNGAEMAEINENLFEKRSLSQIKLLSKALQNLRIEAEGKIAYMYVTYDMINECKADENETEGFVNYAKQIDGCEIGILFKEQENAVKVSYRSKRVNVNKIASLFGGGGHILASGCTIEDTMENAISKVLTACREELKEENLIS